MCITFFRIFFFNIIFFPFHSSFSTPAFFLPNTLCGQCFFLITLKCNTNIEHYYILFHSKFDALVRGFVMILQYILLVAANIFYYNVFISLYLQISLQYNFELIKSPFELHEQNEFYQIKLIYFLNVEKTQRNVPSNNNNKTISCNVVRVRRKTTLKEVALLKLIFDAIFLKIKTMKRSTGINLSFLILF